MIDTPHLRIAVKMSGIALDFADLSRKDFACTGSAVAFEIQMILPQLASTTYEIERVSLKLHMADVSLDR